MLRNCFPNNYFFCFCRNNLSPYEFLSANFLTLAVEQCFDCLAKRDSQAIAMLVSVFLHVRSSNSNILEILLRVVVASEVKPISKWNFGMFSEPVNCCLKSINSTSSLFFCWKIVELLSCVHLYLFLLLSCQANLFLLG